SAATRPTASERAAVERCIGRPEVQRVCAPRKRAHIAAKRDARASPPAGAAPALASASGGRLRHERSTFSHSLRRAPAAERAPFTLTRWNTGCVKESVMGPRPVLLGLSVMLASAACNATSNEPAQSAADHARRDAALQGLAERTASDQQAQRSVVVRETQFGAMVTRELDADPVV